MLAKGHGCAVDHGAQVLGLVGTWPVRYEWLRLLRYPPFVVTVGVSLVVAAILFRLVPSLSLAIVGGLVCSLPVFLWTVPASRDAVGTWLVRSMVAGLMGLALGGTAGGVIAPRRQSGKEGTTAPGMGVLLGGLVISFALSCVVLFRVEQSHEPLNVVLWGAWGAALGVVSGALVGSLWSDPPGAVRRWVRRCAIALLPALGAAMLLAETAWKRVCGVIGSASCDHLITTFARTLVFVALAAGCLVSFAWSLRDRGEPAASDASEPAPARTRMPLGVAGAVVLAAVAVALFVKGWPRPPRLDARAVTTGIWTVNDCRTVPPLVAGSYHKRCIAGAGSVSFTVTFHNEEDRDVVVDACRVRVENVDGRLVATNGVAVPVYLAGGVPYRGVELHADESRTFSWFVNRVPLPRVGRYLVACRGYFPGPPARQWS